MHRQSALPEVREMYTSRAMFLALLITAIAAVMTSGTAWGARADVETNSLKGLGSVYLIVQGPGTDVATDSVNKDTIKSAVHKQLEAAGIKVIDDTKDLKDDGAILLIALSTVKGENDSFACSIDCQLIQIASLGRDSKLTVPATTWTSGVVAMVDSKGAGYLQARVTKLVDEFITDYKTANNVPVSGEMKM